MLPQYPEGIGSRTLVDTQIPSAQVPYIKWCRTIYCQPAASADSQPWVKNTAFHPQLVESTKVKLWGYGGPIVYLLKKNPHISGLMKSKVVLFKGQLYIINMGPKFAASTVPDTK